MKERWFMIAPLRHASQPISVLDARQLQKEDAPQLGNLLHAAYQGTVDDEGESPEEARKEAEQILAGKYGPIMENATAGIFREDELLAAIVFTEWSKLDFPFLAFSITHPKAQRQGLARQLFVSAMNELARSEHRRIGLFVTASNTRAVQLYVQMGFQKSPFPPKPQADD